MFYLNVIFLTYLHSQRIVNHTPHVQIKKAFTTSRIMFTYAAMPFLSVVDTKNVLPIYPLKVYWQHRPKKWDKSFLPLFLYLNIRFSDR